MKKVLSLIVFLSLIMSFVGCGSESPSEDVVADNGTESKTEETIVLRLAETHPDNYPTTQGDVEFARLVEEKSNGRIQIEVYAGGQLGEERDVIEQVQFGAIDLTRVSVAPLAEFSSALNVLQLPYIYRDEDHMWAVLNGSIGDDFLNSIEDSQFLGLGWFDPGARHFYNRVRPIETMDDFSGLKLRVQQSELNLDMVEALGGSPTPLPYGEVYSGIQSGVIDGAENNWPSYYSSSHYEVAGYLTLTGHTRIPEIIIGSQTALSNKLSDSDIELLREAALEAQAYQREQWAAYEEESIEKVTESGVTVIELTDEVREEMSVAMARIYQKHAEEHMDLIEEIQGLE
ncbi:tripartite ATP-independent transporter DctP family solute receptor [Natranaerovirga hydrolytica]|uniref:Tripartite ATP-independent transporter DctP family solute receptor n=1 Tax=Natranaerovirga hydrolytica TaxID=680378 RepID=A0A4R1MZA0_9FIRM|nr:TRAP transporter substrate-binding protein [Natranaerovirga hydrolytica]TCK98596.1 tripartite ATP-independent transporter DctP family solute receptor [Natranaerovirga hydrolytica]